MQTWADYLDGLNAGISLKQVQQFMPHLARGASTASLAAGMDF